MNYVMTERLVIDGCEIPEIITARDPRFIQSLLTIEFISARSYDSRQFALAKAKSIMCAQGKRSSSLVIARETVQENVSPRGSMLAVLL